MKKNNPFPNNIRVNGHSIAGKERMQAPHHTNGSSVWPDDESPRRTDPDESGNLILGNEDELDESDFANVAEVEIDYDLDEDEINDDDLVLDVNEEEDFEDEEEDI